MPVSLNAIVYLRATYTMMCGVCIYRKEPYIHPREPYLLSKEPYTKEAYIHARA